MSQVVEDAMESRREQLLDAIQTDTTRETFERETGLLWNAETDEVMVNSAERSVTRRLLNHDDFELTSWSARYGDRGERTFNLGDFEDWVDTGRPAVFSVRGTLPIGCVTIKAEPRRSSGHSQIVSQAVLRGRDAGNE